MTHFIGIENFFWNLPFKSPKKYDGWYAKPQQKHSESRVINDSNHRTFAFSLNILCRRAVLLPQTIWADSKVPWMEWWTDLRSEIINNFTGKCNRKTYIRIYCSHSRLILEWNVMNSMPFLPQHKYGKRIKMHCIYLDSIVKQCNFSHIYLNFFNRCSCCCCILIVFVIQIVSVVSRMSDMRTMHRFHCYFASVWLDSNWNFVYVFIYIYFFFPSNMHI